MKNLLKIMLTASLCVSASIAAPQKGSMTDPRDEKTYKTVKIGKQVWMAENLNFKSGDSWCYNNSEQNCNEYGRLYSWEAALNACPEGWHLPTKEEFEILMSNVGGEETAGKMLKSTTGWYDDGNGVDKYGFNVLPAGLRHGGGNFRTAGKSASFWSATEYYEDNAYFLGLPYLYEAAGLIDGNKDFAFSVRCLQGSVPQKNETTSQKGTMKDTEIMKDTRDGQTYKTVKIGDQVWMAENLALEITEINGNPGSTNDCLILGGNGKKANCKKYGQFYSALAALVACPEGWHLPSAPELKKLLDYTGNSIDLKSKKGWNTYQQPSGNGTDKYGFNALPSGGCIVGTDGLCAYMDEGKYAYFWTSTIPSDTEGVAYAFLGAPHTDYGFDLAPQSMVLGMWYPVRCVQNEKKNVGNVSADFNEEDATESSSHDACKAAVAKVKNTLNRCKTFPKGSYERSICKKKYNAEKEDAENVCKVTDNSCGRSVADIMKVVRQRMPGLRHIYNKFLKQQPHFQGVVSLRFTIAPGGEIISISIASSTTGYGEFDNEIKTAVSRWNFGKFKCDDGNVANETTVTIPFTFSE